MINWSSLKKNDYVYMATHRCKHKHTYLEHPSCYIKDKMGDLKIGYLDIESGGLKANFDYILTWVIKTKGKNEYKYGKIKKSEINDFTFDKRIVKELIQAMLEYDVIITYYGSRFDIPFIRSRALSHNMLFPEFGTLRHIDVYYMVKTKMCLHKNSLDSACALLDIKGKTHIKGNYWMRAVVGDSVALKYVLDHNLADVKILERLHNKLDRYCKFTNRSI